jgi:hypothetical protein
MIFPFLLGYFPTTSRINLTQLKNLTVNLRLNVIEASPLVTIPQAASQGAKFK